MTAHCCWFAHWKRVCWTSAPAPIPAILLLRTSANKDIPVMPCFLLPTPAVAWYAVESLDFKLISDSANTQYCLKQSENDVQTFKRGLTRFMFAVGPRGAPDYLIDWYVCTDDTNYLPEEMYHIRLVLLLCSIFLLCLCRWTAVCCCSPYQAINSAVGLLLFLIVHLTLRLLFFIVHRFC